MTLHAKPPSVRTAVRLAERMRARQSQKSRAPGDCLKTVYCPQFKIFYLFLSDVPRFFLSDLRTARSGGTHRSASEAWGPCAVPTGPTGTGLTPRLAGHLGSRACLPQACWDLHCVTLCGRPGRAPPATQAPRGGQPASPTPGFQMRESDHRAGLGGGPHSEAFVWSRGPGGLWGGPGSPVTCFLLFSCISLFCPKGLSFFLFFLAAELFTNIFKI